MILSSCMIRLVEGASLAINDAFSRFSVRQWSRSSVFEEASASSPADG